MSDELRKIVAHASAIVDLVREIDPDDEYGVLESVGVGSDIGLKPVTQYRNDGFSHETSRYGARRHQIVDEALDALIDAGLADVAAEADAWFIFPPDLHPELWPSSKDEQEVAEYAMSKHGALWWIRSKRTPWFSEFKVPLDKPEPALNRHFEKIDGHAVVLLPKTYEPETARYRQWTADEAMEYYANNLRSRI